MRKGQPQNNTESADISPRIRLLREALWRRTHESFPFPSPSGKLSDGSLLGNAKNFAAWLDEMPPQIQDHELLAGVSVLRIRSKHEFCLGHYNPHYPPGHHKALRLGFTGIRDRARGQMEKESDPAKRDFLDAVAISHDAACRFAEKQGRYVSELAANADPDRAEELRRIARACAEIADGPPRSFHAALQLFWFVFMFGSEGCIGRFDQWMWPFLDADLRAGRIAMPDAQELLDSLWIKLNFFGSSSSINSAAPNDSLRNMALAGQTADGADACNPLTFMCLAATERLRLPEPKINVRFFNGSPRKLLMTCCRMIAKGLSQPAIYNDEVALPGLLRAGIPIEDAREYCNDGCQELIIGGRCTEAHVVNDMLEILRGSVFRAETTPYADFADVMADARQRLEAWMPNDHGLPLPVTFPFFAGTIDHCLEEASPTGAKYHIHGNIIAETANCADGLAAIKRLIFDEKAATWPELCAALRANYDGHEPLRQMILHRAPKFGNDEDEVDAIATELVHHFLDGIHAHAGNAPGPGPKRLPGIMSFGLQSRRNLPASADGRRQGDPTANSFSPAPGCDRQGPTAVLNSVGKVDAAKASFGATLDLALHTSCFVGSDGLDKLAALVETFLTKPCCTTLQVNVIDRDALLQAQAHPTDPAYRTLLVRVWGFSAVFVELCPALQDHILQRTEHIL
ncbi:MAG: pyruvate formate lyase family protein [Planctomycetota bacterium]